MPKLRISRFTTRILLGWTILLIVALLTLTFAHVVVPNQVTFHALTLNSFFASLLMGLRIMVLFLVFSTLPMLWPVTLLSFLCLTIGSVALAQLVGVFMQGSFVLSLVYLVFVVTFCGFLYTAVLLTNETIMGNGWGEPGNEKGYLINWLTSLLNTLRRVSLPILVLLLVSSVTLALTNTVNF